MHLTHLQAIILSVLQGVSELFPVSSLGHAVLLPKILLWSLNEKSDQWLSFLVALHLGTAVALLVYFREEWLDVVKAFYRSIAAGHISQDGDDRLAWMVLLGTIPAGVVGLALQTSLRSLFGTPAVAACFLIVNGVIMFVGERLIKRQNVTRSGVAARAEAAQGSANTATGGNRYRDITQLSWRDAAIVGFAQVGALFPGISRSGITMVAGLAAGLTHEASARFAFLLATPIIGAAGLLEVPKLFAASGRSVLGDALVGMVLAGIAAYVSVRFLMRFFETNTLIPFAVYCLLAGLGCTLYFAT